MREFLRLITTTRPALCVLCTMALAWGSGLYAQTPPTATQIASFSELHAAAHFGDTEVVEKLIDGGDNLETRDSYGRTAIHIAAFASHEQVLCLLADAGADMNALEHQAYDAVTIAAVANDLDMLRTALEKGNRPSNITSPYIGTALIAAAHLGHYEVVGTLIQAGAPLDHVNNLAWTALIEAVVLGDGGADHIRTVSLLVAAGADTSIGDMSGMTPLDLALERGYQEIADIIRQ